eukprot:scaffold65372_cov45-Tisochrysis_lutea.AAC.2
MKFNHAEDKSHLLAPILKPIFLAYDTLPCGDVDTFSKLEKNNVENEPYFIVLMLIAGLLKAIPSELGATLCTLYMYSRLAHSVTFCTMPYIGAAPRTLTYLPGLVITIFVCFSVLSGSAAE